MPRSRMKQSKIDVSVQQPLEEKLSEKTLIEEQLAPKELAAHILSDREKKAVLATYMGLSPKRGDVITPYLVEQHFAIYEEKPIEYQMRMAMAIAPMQKEGYEWHERPSILLRRRLLEKAQEVVEIFDAHHPVSVKVYAIGPMDFTKEGVVRDEFGDFVGVIKARRSKKGEIKSSFLAKAELTGGKKGKHAAVYLLASASGPTGKAAMESSEELRTVFPALLRRYGKAILGREGHVFIGAFAREMDKALRRHEGEVDAFLLVNKPGEVLVGKFGEGHLYTFNGAVKEVEVPENAPWGLTGARRGKVKVAKLKAEALLYLNPSVSASPELVAQYKDKERALKRILSSSKGAKRNRDYSGAVVWLL